MPENASDAVGMIIKSNSLLIEIYMLQLFCWMSSNNEKHFGKK